MVVIHQEKWVARQRAGWCKPGAAKPRRAGDAAGWTAFFVRARCYAPRTVQDPEAT